MKPRLTILLLISVLVIWLFSPAILGQSCFAYRDAGHYYHPLFEYIRSEWGAGRLPLWNPYENCGVPLLAGNTSSVFYPGKLLFVLPLDYTWLYCQYIILHVLLALLTSYALARQLRAGKVGAAIGAISYAFCGNVLFQYCNVIFLVGAAWLPLALLFADRMLRQRHWKSTIGFGVVVALIVLGGDPHLAYNTALATGGYALLLWWRENRNTEPISRRRLPWRLGYLTMGLALAGMLAAIQVLPTFEASPHGERSHYDAPRSIYEYARVNLVADTGVENTASAFLKVPSSAHHSHVYYFSVEPWRAIELIWPNVSGRPFPTHRRWMNAIDAEHVLWVPSLYMGLLPIFLALSRWSLRSRTPVEIQGMSWLALLAVVASFGWYSLGWMVRLILGVDDEPRIGGEAGGLYWLFVSLLPGYVQFRYPAKVWVLASLALSMLAARAWRHLWNLRSRVWMALVAVPLLSGVVCTTGFLVWANVRERLSTSAMQTWLGPFDWLGAWTDFVDGMLHASLLSLVLVLVLQLAYRWPRYRQLLQLVTVAIICVDLGVAQKYLIEYAPAQLWAVRPSVLKKLPDIGEYRLFRQPSVLPPSFSNFFSSDRVVETVRWDRQTLFPEYPLPLHVSIVHTSQNVASNDYDVMIDVSRKYSRRNNKEILPEASILDLVGARTAFVDMNAREEFDAAQKIAEGMFMADRPNALPRAWIVHQVVTVPEFQSRSPKAIEKFTRNLMFPDNKPRDWHKVAVVETDQPIKLEPVNETAAGESCKITHAEPQRVEINAKLQTEGLVVLADQIFPGWELTVESDGQTREAPILRTNRVFRGVLLPAGEHRLVYRYRPKSFYLGALISGLSVTAIAAGMLIYWRRQRAALRHSN